MCNVCAAGTLINGETLSLKSKFNKNNYQIQGWSESGYAEFSPATYRICRNGKWSDVFSTNDLASATGMGGFDMKDSARTERMDSWLDSHFGFRGIIRSVVGF